MKEYSRDLVAGQQMNLGDVLFSATRAFQLRLQAEDGNLVLYVIDDATLPPDITQGQYTKAVWSAGTNGKGVVRCNMQPDGNLVLYNGNGNPVWAPQMNLKAGAFLRCQDDGNLVIYFGGAVLWQSGTAVKSRGKSMGFVFPPAPPPPPPPPAQQVWWQPDPDGPAPGGHIVFGSGFAGDECTVWVAGNAFINPTSARGNISKGVPVSTPCTNTGQTVEVKVTADADPNNTVTVNLEC